MLKTGSSSLAYHNLENDSESTVINVSPKKKSNFVSAMGNFSVAYNLTSASIALAFMQTDEGYPVDSEHPERIATYPEPAWGHYALLGLVFAGAITGMCIMGYLGDLIGNRKAMLLTLALTVVGALGSALLSWGSVGAVYIIIGLSRFVLGMGVGGIYPLSAIKAAASSSGAENVSRRVGMAFFWQMPGSMAPYILGALLYEALPHTAWAVSLQFRLLLGLGAIPAMVVFWAEYRETAEGKGNGKVDPSSGVFKSNSNSKASNDSNNDIGANNSNDNFDKRDEKDNSNSKKSFRKKKNPKAVATIEDELSESLLSGNEDMADVKLTPLVSSSNNNNHTAQTKTTYVPSQSKRSKAHPSSGDIGDAVLDHDDVEGLADSEWKRSFARQSFVSAHSLRSEGKDLHANVHASDGPLRILKEHPEFLYKLIGTGGSWFIYDVAYYGTAIFTPTILKSIFGKSDSLISLCWQSIIVTSLGVPACLLGISQLKGKGARWLNIVGFYMIAASFACLALVYSITEQDSHPTLKFILFCIVTFSLNVGPSIGTYVLPSETYPKNIRSSFNGLSAASGKIGAVVGTFIYSPINDVGGLAAVMWLQCALAVIGAIISQIFLAKPTAIGGEELNYSNIGDKRRSSVTGLDNEQLKGKNNYSQNYNGDDDDDDDDDFKHHLELSDGWTGENYELTDTVHENEEI